MRSEEGVTSVPLREYVQGRATRGQLDEAKGEAETDETIP